MTLSLSDTLRSGRGGGCSLHVARLFERPITIIPAYQTANQVAMRNLMVRCSVKRFGESYRPVYWIGCGAEGRLASAAGHSFLL